MGAKVKWAGGVEHDEPLHALSAWFPRVGEIVYAPSLTRESCLVLAVRANLSTIEIEVEARVTHGRYKGTLSTFLPDGRF